MSDRDSEPRTQPADSATEELATRLALGVDPLGNKYCERYSAEERRAQGVTLTPAAIVDWIIGEATRRCPDAVRIVDAGAGTGRFTVSAATAFPHAEIVAVEKSPVLATILRQNLTAAGLSKRVKVVLGDYREMRLSSVNGPTIHLGNPPYVRHHDIPSKWKTWYEATMRVAGIKASQLAGLHLHFFAKAISDARPGDLVFFITPAEWLDVGYGSALRSLILKCAASADITVLGRESQIFDDALTTSALTLLQVGTPLGSVGMREIKSVDDLSAPHAFTRFTPNQLGVSERWTNLTGMQDDAPGLDGRVELGELFAVHRGQVTGMNSVWTARSYDGPLPETVLFPSITRARELLSLPMPRLHEAAALKRVVDLPEDLDTLDQEARGQVLCFLDWAKDQGAHKRYIARHRSPWYRVGLRDPAPIVMTYMARRPPRFVRNLCGARLINIAHGLYPRTPMSSQLLDTFAHWLNSNTSVRSGRTYAGGLTKFEPGEVMRLLIPPLPELRALGTST